MSEPGGKAMDVAVVGAGHVGLVTGACFGLVGHRVRIADVDADKIDRLEAGGSPFYEPGLDDLLAEVRRAGRISFHLGAADAVRGAELIFMCVDTPNAEDGRVDLASLTPAARDAAPAPDCRPKNLNRRTAP